MAATAPLYVSDRPAIAMMTFVDNELFRTTTIQRRWPKYEMPAIPASSAPEPWMTHRVAPTYVMARQEERERFLAYNFAKYRHNQLLKATKRAKSRKQTDAAWEAVFVAEAKVKHLYEYLTRVNLPLVYSQIARNRSRFGVLDWNEAVSEGELGLMRALNGYDVNFGTKFSTYAVRIVLNCLMSAAIKAKKRIDRLGTVEMPDSFGTGDDGRAGDGPPIDDIEALRHVLQTNKGGLTGQEFGVIAQRYGMGCDRRTLEELGDSMGVSKERIRQIQNRALSKLRDAFATR